MGAQSEGEEAHNKSTRYQKWGTHLPTQLPRPQAQSIHARKIPPLDLIYYGSCILAFRIARNTQCSTTVILIKRHIPAIPPLTRDCQSRHIGNYLLIIPHAAECTNVPQLPRLSTLIINPILGLIQCALDKNKIIIATAKLFLVAACCGEGAKLSEIENGSSRRQ